MSDSPDPMPSKSSEPHSTGRPFDPRRARRQMLWLSVALFVAVGLVVAVLIHIHGFEAVRRGWDRVSPRIQIIKWAGLIVIIWQWDEIIRQIAVRARMSPDYRDYLLGLRWRVATALLILEILSGQNLLSRLLN